MLKILSMGWLFIKILKVVLGKLAKKKSMMPFL